MNLYKIVSDVLDPSGPIDPFISIESLFPYILDKSSIGLPMINTYLRSHNYPIFNNLVPLRDKGRQFIYVSTREISSNVQYYKKSIWLVDIDHPNQAEIKREIKINEILNL